MKLEIVYLDNNLKISTIGRAKEIIKNRAFLFSYSFVVDLDMEEIILVLIFADSRNDNGVHYLPELVSRLRHVEGNFGGGKVRIKGRRMTFFGSSYGLGSYQASWLKKMEHRIKKIFDVDVVRYYSDYDKKVATETGTEYKIFKNIIW